MSESNRAKTLSSIINFKRKPAVIKVKGAQYPPPDEYYTTDSERKTPPSTPQTPRLSKFQHHLSLEHISLPVLRKLCWGGIPGKQRPRMWLILLEILPLHLERRERVYKKRIADYAQFVNEYNDSHSKLTKSLSTIHKQISLDVPRTHPTLPLFQCDAVRNALQRVLYVWAVRHPASGYVQGINDIVTPFFCVFLGEELGLGSEDASVEDTLAELADKIAEIGEEGMLRVEASCFWCLTKVLEGVQENYTFAQPGIQKMVHQLAELVQRIDSPLHEHLETQGLLYLQFSFRWFNCLLLRELSLPLVIRLFDTYASEGKDVFSSFHVYVCASFLVSFSEQLRELEFQDLIVFIQHLPTERWGEREIATVISQAYVYQTLFSESPSHLK